MSEATQVRTCLKHGEFKTGDKGKHGSVPAGRCPACIDEEWDAAFTNVSRRYLLEVRSGVDRIIKSTPKLHLEVAELLVYLGKSLEKAANEPAKAPDVLINDSTSITADPQPVTIVDGSTATADLEARVTALESRVANLEQSITPTYFVPTPENPGKRLGKNPL